MAKYIEFPVVMDGIEVLQIFNTNNISIVNTAGSKQFCIYCGLIRYTYTSYNVDEGEQKNSHQWVEVINKAILTVSGPTLVSVVIPEGYVLTNPSIQQI